MTTLDGVAGMNELNLVSPVNNVSPVFIPANLHHQPTLVKELRTYIGKICVVKLQNSTQKHYTAFNCQDRKVAEVELHAIHPQAKFTQRMGYRFVLLEIAVDDRNNILLKCLGAEGEPLVYWMPFYSRNMKITAI